MNLNKKKLLNTLMFLGFLVFISPIQAQEYESNALYVKFKNNAKFSYKNLEQKNSNQKLVSTSQLKFSNALISQYGIHSNALSMSLFDNEILDKTFRITFDNTTDLDKIIKAIEKRADVEYVEKVPVARISSVSNKAKKADTVIVNDPYYGTVDGFVLNWPLDLIHTNQAWTIQRGKPNIKVAIVDNAIWGEHEDLQIPASLQYNVTSNLPGNSAPPSTVNQHLTCPALYDQACPTYDWSHGTHCAGVVGALNNNGKGIASLASGVTLMGVGCPYPSDPDRVLGGTNGIVWAAEHGAKVISCSWGGAGSSTEDAVLKSCYDEGIVIVAAAGNDNSSDLQYPGSSPYCIGVGSVDYNRQKSDFSNYGYWVDITAPGGAYTPKNTTYPNVHLGIFSTTFCKNQSLRLSGVPTFNDHYYDEMQGTSMACPLVASLCALMLSNDSTLSPAEIKTILQNTSQKVENNSGFPQNAGIIDAYQALLSIASTKFYAPASNLRAIVKLDTVRLSWQAPQSADSLKITGYNVYRFGKLVAKNIQETSFRDTLVPAGTHLYQVAAMYPDGISVREEITANVKMRYSVTLRCSPDSAGILTGDGVYNKDAFITVKASPNEGYKFKKWTDNGKVNFTNPNYTFAVSRNILLYAIFEKDVASEELDPSLLSVSPNPTNNEVNIRCNVANIEHISICNMQGQTVLTVPTIKSHEATLSIEHFRKGAYLLHVETEKGKFVTKIFKL